MQRRSANILLEGKREIRAIGDNCDPSCFTWFACANSKPNDVCKGFVLLNGDRRKLINNNLTENDVIYVENCMRIIQNGNSEEPKERLVQEVLRYIPPQPTQHQEGFLGMLEASTGMIERNTEEEKQEPSASGFQRMLSESGKSEQPHTVVERQIQPFDFEAKLPLLCDESCPATRYCSSYPNNLGALCVKRYEQFRNPRTAETHIPQHPYKE
jgi:hypothetical protein